MRVILIGSESLTIEAGRQMLARGYKLQAVVTHSADVRSWAAQQGLDVLGFGAGLSARLGGSVDWIFSVANLEMLPADLLALGTKGAVNFHDGPLPRYAGLNAPVWALLNGEARHGITWHLIEGGVDEGRIIAQEGFDIRPSETAFTLNTRCFEAGVQSFERVLDAVDAGLPSIADQDLSARSYFALSQRPASHGFVDHTRPMAEALQLVHALDHGPYWNPLCTAKLRIGGDIFHLGQAEKSNLAGARTGKVLEVDSAGFTLSFPDGALRFTQVTGDLSNLRVGDIAAAQTFPENALRELEQAAKADQFWRERLKEFIPATLPLEHSSQGSGWSKLALDAANAAHLPDALFALARDLSEAPCDVALGLSPSTALVSHWVPVRDVQEIERARAKGGFAKDLLVRDSALSGTAVPAIGISSAAPVEGTAITLIGEHLHFDEARLCAASARLLADRLNHASAQIAAGQVPEGMPASELALLDSWNQTTFDVDPQCIAQLFEAQVERTPQATALVVEDAALTYEALNQAANRAAHVLQSMEVGPDVLVGLYINRSVEMVVAALAILKAGGAYVPLDPAYPNHRIAGYLEDSAAPVIVTTSALVDGLPEHSAEVLLIDTDPRLEAAPTTSPAASAGPENLAYVIFTSGSTGRPKGVMVEHRNLSNFFTGMDARIPHDPAGTWLAVTSLNFDISVLELFYSLVRGFKLVVTSDESRAVISNGPVMTSDAEMDFSIYYWGNDDGAGEKKYELLLEGAKFADQNGFCAVWTPERHFHAFGGPYPNPSVTGAAVAAVTQNIGVRSGSCVAPLHHPARIAEEWAVIDNLTNGRAGLAMASGWQPDDFVLRPENTPPENKPALLETIETVRKLWRGEIVEFPKSDGTMHGVVTQPRPVSKEVPIWVTTAGNPETWKEAGRIGANVLTHLLGQSIDEVADKITLYHAALREAGHDPADFKVTLMLHTFIADTREIAREIAREPMKDYLRSAAGLIKQYAWAFPAFKRPEGVDNAFQLDLGSLEEEELEGILDFAFLRYFEDSGLFGTVQDCVTKVEALKRIGVNEVACLIDYGIGTEQVLEGLKPLAEVVRRSNAVQSMTSDDYSIAAQLVRHEVTHLQCTPSMARMLCMDDDARAALSGVQHMMLGGEALPGALVAELQASSSAQLINMYGPTETTIWSSTHVADAGAGTVPLGRPIANTQFYVLDPDGARCPIGKAGELCIGGAGVTRGYLGREDLTQERFGTAPDGARMYRTGDLVRYLADGTLEFLGRVDHQIKLRGYRIELGEIETALERQTGVRQAVVIAREDTPGDVRLIGYVTGTGLARDGLRAALKAELPPHMVPNMIELLDAFPLTPNKKVDRAALPAVTPSAPEPSAPAPRLSAPSAGGDFIAQIAAIWSRILGVQDIAPSDNFFDIGGHSLLAVQAHREIREVLNAKISITDVFRFPVLSALAQKVEASGAKAGATRAPATANPETQAPQSRANARVDAMSKRRAMRAARLAR